MAVQTLRMTSSSTRPSGPVREFCRTVWRPSQLMTEGWLMPASSWSKSTSAARPRIDVEISATVASALTSITSDRVSNKTGRCFWPTSASQISPRLTADPTLRLLSRRRQRSRDVSRTPRGRPSQGQLERPRLPLAGPQPRCSHRVRERAGRDLHPS